MSEFNNERVYSTTDSLQSYLTKTFTTMATGLGLTALIAFLGYTNIINGGWLYSLLVNAGSMVSVVALVAELGICVALGRGITTMSTSKMRTLFYVYSAITGITFSVLPISFGVLTVFTAFVYSAVMFASCAFIGHYTNVDLSKFSGIMIGALIALVVASVLSIFIPSLASSLWISYLGIIIFAGLTAWDLQKIKSFYYSTQGDELLQNNLSVYGAFNLYLDFINIFLYVLRILGNRRSK